MIYDIIKNGLYTTFYVLDLDNYSSNVRNN